MNKGGGLHIKDEANWCQW